MPNCLIMSYRFIVSRLIIKVGIVIECRRLSIAINDDRITKRLVLNFRCCCQFIRRCIKAIEQQAPQVVAALSPQDNGNVMGC